MRVLYWLDIETTGLNPIHNKILEIAISKAPFDDPFNARLVHHSVYAFPHDRDMLEPAVREMHENSGLLTDCEYLAYVGQPRAVHGPELCDLFDEGEEPIFAGSSVHFDVRFLRASFPEFALKFSHRHYDVSAIKLFCESLGMPKLPKGEAHRAQADILESIEHARACAQWLATKTAIGVADAIAKKLGEYA